MERWNEKDYLLTLDLYYKIKETRASMGASNPQVQDLAKKINRTPSSVAMRLQNYAFFDTQGEKGLKNGGKACEIYLNKFNGDKALLEEEINDIQKIVVANKPKSQISPEVINSIVVNLVYELKAPQLISGDNNIFTTLTIMGEYLECDDFKFADLQLLSEKIQNLPDFPTPIFFRILKDNLEKDQASKIIDLFGIFDPKFRYQNFEES